MYIARLLNQSGSFAGNINIQYLTKIDLHVN